jgi:hypothetical protein
MNSKQHVTTRGMLFFYVLIVQVHVQDLHPIVV